MKPYEETLGKIAPIFHKLVQYQKLRADYYYLINQYIFSADLPIVSHVDLIFSKNISYFYATGSNYFEKSIYTIIVRLRTTNSADLLEDIYTDEIIVNMVINKFSFENQKIVKYLSQEKLNTTYKDLFIALIGKDTYDTIRRNIK